MAGDGRKHRSKWDTKEVSHDIVEISEDESLPDKTGVQHKPDTSMHHGSGTGHEKEQADGFNKDTKELQSKAPSERSQPLRTTDERDEWSKAAGSQVMNRYADDRRRGDGRGPARSRGYSSRVPSDPDAWRPRSRSPSPRGVWNRSRRFLHEDGGHRPFEDPYPPDPRERCARGASCRFAHGDSASRGGWRDEARESGHDRVGPESSYGNRTEHRRTAAANMNNENVSSMGGQNAAATVGDLSMQSVGLQSSQPNVNSSLIAASTSVPPAVQSNQWPWAQQQTGIVQTGLSVPSEQQQQAPQTFQMPIAIGSSNGNSIHLPHAGAPSGPAAAAASVVNETVPPLSKKGENKDSDAEANEDGDNKKSKDTKPLKMFKVALADFVKEALKPTWKEGQMSREAHKTIVKKVVDKVTSTVENTPPTKEKIEIYMSYSKEKLNKLVQAYVGKYAKA
nr:unnamed protein product [Digitaria exilis]